MRAKLMMEDIKMLEFAKNDMDTWARREHYIYYTEKLKIEFNMIANRNLGRYKNDKFSGTSVPLCRCF